MVKKIKQLSNVFEEEFHYKVSSIQLSTTARELPQVQVNFYIAEFVHREDGPATLLIVYYAGHGVPTDTPGGLELSRFFKKSYCTKTPAN